MELGGFLNANEVAKAFGDQVRDLVVLIKWGDEGASHLVAVVSMAARVVVLLPMLAS